MLVFIFYIKVLNLCLFVCVCLGVFVTNEDINLYNDIGITRRR